MPQFLFNLIFWPLFATIFYAFWRRTARNVALRRLALAKNTAIDRLSERSSHKIVGNVRYAEAPLEAPFSGRPCVCYEATVLERGYVAARETKAVDFHVEDETGRVLVRAEGLRFLAKTKRLRWVSRSQAGSRLETFLKDRGRSTRLLWLRNMGCREGVVEEGQKVAVLGTAFSELDRDGMPGMNESYRDRAQRIVVRTTEETPLIVSDDEIMFD